MPTTPYATLLASVAAGAPTAGGLTATPGQTVQLSGESTAQWTQQKYEIYQYPVGFAAPAGWSTDGAGVYFYSTTSTPPIITLSAATTPAKYLFRLTVNNGLSGAGVADPTLVDEATAVRVAGAGGLHAFAPKETTQWSAAKKWAGDLQADIVALDTAVGGGVVPVTRTLTAGAGLTGGGTLAADRTFDVAANADGSITVNANDIQVGILATDAQHGVRGGGTQHANAVAAGAAGFMTGADKTKLDGITAGAAIASVSGTAPIVSSGGTTPAISITAASGADPGSMSAAHYTLVNDATATPTASKIAKWDASVYMGATRFYGSGTVATAGVLAVANNVVAVAARSSGGTDISLLTTDGSDKFTVGDANDASALDLASAGAARVLVGAFLAWHANDRGVSFLIAPSFGGGEGVLGLGNATTAPTTAPTGGVVVYSDAAAVKVWTPNKVRTTLAPEGNAAHTDQRLDELWRTVTTADATITTIGTYTLPAACCAVLRCVVTGQQTGTDSTCVYTFDVTFRRAAGIAGSTTGTVTTIIDAIGVAAVPSCDTDGANDGRVRVTGRAATDIDWALSVTHLHLYSV